MRLRDVRSVFHIALSTRARARRMWAFNGRTPPTRQAVKIIVVYGRSFVGSLTVRGDTVFLHVGAFAGSYARPRARKQINFHLKPRSEAASFVRKTPFLSRRIRADLSPLPASELRDSRGNCLPQISGQQRVSIPKGFPLFIKRRAHPRVGN